MNYLKEYKRSLSLRKLNKSYKDIYISIHLWMESMFKDLKVYTSDKHPYVVYFGNDINNIIIKYNMVGSINVHVYEIFDKYVKEFGKRIYVDSIYPIIYEYLTKLLKIDNCSKLQTGFIGFDVYDINNKGIKLNNMFDHIDIKIREHLIKYNIPVTELDRFNEPNRYYHNLEHVKYMVNTAIEKGIVLSDELFLAIIFHDIIYDSTRTDNEEQSAELLYSYVKNENIKTAILETKHHNPVTNLGKELCMLDLNILYSDMESFMDFENKIFKEYEFVDYSIYVTERVKILESLNVCDKFIDYVKYRKVNIAVYPGTFNPFHKGHLNILEKAEEIFDKVIILQGENPDKKDIKVEVEELPICLKYRQIEKFTGLLTTYINTIKYPVTIIRGLRNSTDLQYELTQYRYLQDLKPDIKVVSIFCDKEYEHISSSAIRKLKNIDIDSCNKYLI